MLLTVPATSLGQQQEWSEGLLPNGYVSRHWTMQEGLPLATVKDIAQSHDGYLWLGTWDGISRFDGIRFTSYNLVTNPELNSANTNAFLEDPNGDLWVGTGVGLARFEKGKFRVFTEEDGIRSGRMVRCVARDANGTLWIGTPDGLFRKTGETFQPFPLLEEHEVRKAGRDVSVRALGVNKKGLWIGARQGLYLIEAATGKAAVILAGQAIGNIETDPTDERIAFVLDKVGVAWFEESGEPRNIDEPKAISLERLHNGNVWIGTSDARLLELPTEDPTSARLIARLPGAEVHDITQDREDNIWVGNSGGGLFRFHRAAAESHADDPELPSKDVGAIYAATDGHIWFGSFGDGVYRRENGEWQAVAIGDGTGDGTGEGSVVSMCEDSDGTLWLALYGGGRFKFTSGGRFELVDVIPDGCRSMIPSRHGGVWIGGKENGVFRDTGDGELIHYSVENGLSSNKVTTLAEDPKGDLWVGTLHGLNRISNGQITQFFREDGLGVNALRYLFTDHRGALWIGNAGAGLVRHKDGKFSRLTTRHGLVNDYVTTIIEDDHANLWIGTANGLCAAPIAALDRCLDGESATVEFLSFGHNEGIRIPTFGTGFQPGCTKAADGKLWFCAGNELAVFDPWKIFDARHHDHPTPVFLEEMWIDGREQRIYGNAETPEAIKVPPGHHRLEFVYTGLHLSAPEKVKFKYRLEGYDDDWVSAGGSRQASYTRVRPGRYRFRVTAASEGGNWSESDASLAVTVLPEWWQSWWFRGVIGLAILCLAAGLYQLRMAAWRRRRALQEEFTRRLIDTQEAERKRIAAGLHDGLGQGLLILKNQVLLAQRNAENPGETRKQLEQISTATTEAISEVRAIAYDLRPFELDRLGFTEAIKSLLERLSDSTALAVETKLDNIDGIFAPELETNLYRFFQEALANLVKHADASQITVETRHGANLVVLSVTDDGRGFDPSKPPPHSDGTFGIGLADMEERARLLGGEFAVRSQLNQGTTVMIKLPTPTDGAQRGG